MNLKFKLLILYLIKEIIAFLLFIPGFIFLKSKFTNQKVLFILNYHNFSKYNNDKLKRGSIIETGYAKNFERQIHFLKKYFHFCNPEDFFQGKAEKGINVLLTFDDGYKDNYDIAFPILKKNQIPTIFFVATMFLNSKDFIMHDKVKFLVQENILSKNELNILRKLNLGEEYSKEYIENIEELFFKNYPNHLLMMNNKEVKELDSKGFIIGNHTYRHDVLSFLTKEDQNKTIKMADDYLISILGDGSQHIAYPNGMFNTETLEVLDELNINYGYTTLGGYNKEKDSEKELKRIGVNVSDSINFILLKMLLFSTFKFGKSN